MVDISSFLFEGVWRNIIIERINEGYQDVSCTYRKRHVLDSKFLSPTSIQLSQ